MNPTGAPDPLDDSDGIVWGIFVLTAGAREQPAGVALEPPGDSGRIVWGVFVTPQCPNGSYPLHAEQTTPTTIPLMLSSSLHVKGLTRGWWNEL